jgi:5-methylthioadenosine/S-adenosylhomocysteine deaminase
MKILLKDIDIITADRQVPHIKKGNVGISGERIAFVNASAEVVKSFKPDRVIDGKNRLVMPGLVNAHTHSAMTLLRNMADDLALEEWLVNKIFPVEARLTPEDVYWGTMLGIIEMIKSGTTAFADMYIHMDEVARAVTESGIRANLCRNPIKVKEGEKLEIKNYIDGRFEFFMKWNGSANGRIKVYVEVHSTYLFNEDTLKLSAELAKHYGTGIHIHLLETAKEREESIVNYGMDSVEICEKCGILDVPVLAAHCVHLSDSDIDILKKKKVKVVHNPTSNLKLGSGIAPVPSMLEDGILVALGTDGASSNNNLNMFEEINLAALLHKGVHMNSELVNAEQAVCMATINSSEAIGFGGVTGCIKEGMKADMIILDTDKPHLCPLNNPVSAVAYAAQASDVETVIVDGNILMDNKELKTIDEQIVKHKVREISERIGV